MQWNWRKYVGSTQLINVDVELFRGEEKRGKTAIIKGEIIFWAISFYWGECNWEPPKYLSQKLKCTHFFSHNVFLPKVFKYFAVSRREKYFPSWLRIIKCSLVCIATQLKSHFTDFFCCFCYCGICSIYSFKLKKAVNFYIEFIFLFQ